MDSIPIFGHSALKFYDKIADERTVGFWPENAERREP
jgi:hypothetical protein